MTARSGVKTSGAAIVTGARRGIGRAIAHALALRAFNILVVDIEADASAHETMSALHEKGVEARFVAADIGVETKHGDILDAAEELGTLTTLINNAGVSSTVRGDMLDLPVDSLDRSWRVNLRAPFLLTQAFSKRLIAQPAGDEESFRSIVNITSVNAEILGLNRPDYCMTKAALSTMTRLFAARLAEAGIHVYEVRPGMTMTDMTAPSRDRYDRAIEEGVVPMRRWGVPMDVGAAVAVLATGAFRFSTGDAVHVDGGLHMHRL